MSGLADIRHPVSSAIRVAKITFGWNLLVSRGRLGRQVKIDLKSVSISMFVFSIWMFLNSVLQTSGQVIDVGDGWETNCPEVCSCQISRFLDLPLNQWLNPTRNDPSILEEASYQNYLADEFVRSATCVITDDPSELLNQLPSDLQAFTILESGTGDKEITLRPEVLQRFTELIALDIQGLDHKENNQSYAEDESQRRNKKGGIVMTANTLLPLGLNLLYLNLERVTLTSLNSANRNTVNLVVEPVNQATDSKVDNTNSSASQSTRNGHRLILLSQQNSEGHEDKEILPYDIYKQVLEGYHETGGLFTGLSVLTHLRVYDCALQNISWHMFDGLENLVYLSLEKNDLKVIPEFCFYGTPKLKTLSLARNQLLTLSSVDLAGLLMLQRLDLSGNNLTFLSELSFPPFPALTLADFQDNPFFDLFPNTFEIMNRTTKLYIGGNGSKIKLQKNAFVGLRNLEALHIFNVDVPVLERFMLHGMPRLIHLKIRGNVAAIDFDAFLDSEALEDLDLSNCNIRRISMDAFYGLKSVRRIDLSYNQLDSIPPGLFTVQHQTMLQDIMLNKNFLTTLPPDFFNNLRTFSRSMIIQNLRLDGNPWECTCEMARWNPYLVNKSRDTSPRCFTPKKLRNWGIFHALRKGGLGCKRPKRKYRKSKIADGENSIN